jgi:uncharacterized protein YbbC (DUF1343 family)
VLLDPPNPLGGAVAEGPLLESESMSFVGGATSPLRHGLTLGELARLMNAEQQIGARLEVLPMAGWRREMLYGDTGRMWVAPSPNMPRIETTLLYPGQVLLEGTNLSEGRGTTLPFELVGAPFIDAHDLARELDRCQLPGLAIRPVRFVPTFDKWRGERCGGVAIHAVEPAAVRSVAATLAILEVVSRLYPGDFAWLPPPYEYEHEKMPIDILFGSPRLRERIGGRDGAPVPTAAPQVTIAELARIDERAWWRRVEPYLLYA